MAQYAWRRFSIQFFNSDKQEKLGDAPSETLNSFRKIGHRDSLYVRFFSMQKASYHPFPFTTLPFLMPYLPCCAVFHRRSTLSSSILNISLLDPQPCPICTKRPDLPASTSSMLPGYLTRVLKSRRYHCLRGSGVGRACFCRT